MSHCDKCEHYLEMKQSTPSHPWSAGECHRYAPKPVMIKEDPESDYRYLAIWPLVTDSDFCGEWTVKLDEKLK